MWFPKIHPTVAANVSLVCVATQPRQDPITTQLDRGKPSPKRRTARWAPCAQILLVSVLLVAGSTVSAAAEDSDDPVAVCLKAWGKHPFGKKPSYKTLSTSVKVFGIGKDPTDADETASPSLVLVNPGVNVMGGTTFSLLNPNGWYCMRTNVNVMGGMTVHLHCNAKLASTSGASSVSVLSNNNDQQATTVMGSTTIERVGCK